MDNARRAAELFFKGLQAQGAGNLAAAEGNFLEALKLAPGRSSVLINLSVVYTRMGRFAEALSHAEAAVAADGTEPLSWLQLAAVQLKLERYDAALVSLDAVVASGGSSATVHNSIGIALKGLSRLDEALASYDKAIALKPDYAEACSNRGIVLQSLRRHDEALGSHDRAIALKADYAEAYNSRGIVLQSLRRHDEALASYDKAIALKPDYAEAYSNRGIVLQNLKRFGQALASHDRAISLKPDYAEAYNNRGIVLADLKRHDEALTSYDRAISLRPDHADAHVNRGNALVDLKRPDEARASYERAIGLKPDEAGAYYNLGNLLKSLNQPEEALANYERAIALASDHGGALLNTSILLLQRGEFSKGFELQRSRWLIEDAKEEAPRTAIPAWDGAPHEGAILLWAELGLGDEVFFASMLSLLDAESSDVTISADKRLHPIYARSFPRLRLLDRETTRTSIVGEFAAQASIRDLGHLLRVDTQKIAQRRYPYLVSDHARREAYRSTRPFLEKPLVCGISWKSGNETLGQSRSISLHDLAPILTIPGVAFVNLQYGHVADDIAEVRRRTGVAVEMAEGLDVYNDIDGLLSLMDACDVILTIDNVTAHLAGAIGKQSIVLLPTGEGRYWYWGGEQDSLWYPSLRLVYQREVGDWRPAVDEAARYLAALPGLR